MNLEIKGSYKFKTRITTMFLNEEIILLTGNNLITFFGESFFLNRPINENIKPISHISLGNGINRPQKTDTKLGNEIVRKTCSTEADLENKRILLTSTFSPAEILGTREIGVTNGDMLISHDLYERIDSEMLQNNIGEIQVEYSFQLQTSSIRDNWEQKTDAKYLSSNIYYIDEPNTVIGVFESNTNSGYRKVGGIDSLLTIKGGYYYDISLKKLYIRNTTSTDPADDIIYVQTK